MNLRRRGFAAVQALARIPQMPLVFLCSVQDMRRFLKRGFFTTDLPSRLYDPRTYRRRSHPKLWHCYCHLPIRRQARARLRLAPNTQIDNRAIEHRMAMWMSHHWGAAGVFIWSGNNDVTMTGCFHREVLSSGISSVTPGVC